jgi:hypothetical protein
MASADVRSPYGEFAKRQGIIHFAFSEPRKLSYCLLLTLTDKHIPDTPYGFDIVRRSGIVFQFLPQAAHGDIHGTVKCL